MLKYNKDCYPLLSAHTDSWFWRPAKDGETLSGCSHLLIRNLSWAFSPVLAGDAEVPTRPIISGKRALVKPRSVAASHLTSPVRLETYQHHVCGAPSQPHMGKWSCQGRVAKRLWIPLLTTEEYNTATLPVTLRMHPFFQAATTKNSIMVLFKINNGNITFSHLSGEPVSCNVWALLIPKVCF